MSSISIKGGKEGLNADWMTSPPLCILRWRGSPAIFAYCMTIFSQNPSPVCFSQHKSNAKSTFLLFYHYFTQRRPTHTEHSSRWAARHALKSLGPLVSTARPSHGHALLPSNHSNHHHRFALLDHIKPLFGLPAMPTFMCCVSREVSDPDNERSPIAKDGATGAVVACLLPPASPRPWP